MSSVALDGRLFADPELEYLRLRLIGEQGWGGPSYERRRAGWIKSVTHLRMLEGFPHPPAPMLELGCGNGMVSRLFAQEGYEIDGIDLSTNAVLWARDIFEAAGLHGRFQCGAVDAMPFYQAETFELVVDGNCFHCLVGDSRARCLAEVRRVLRPNGTLVISSMCGEPRTEAIRRLFNAETKELRDDGTPFRTLKPAGEIMDEIVAAGFEIVHRVLAQGTWWDHLLLVSRLRL